MAKLSKLKPIEVISHPNVNHLPIGYLCPLGRRKEKPLEALLQENDTSRDLSTTTLVSEQPSILWPHPSPMGVKIMINLSDDLIQIARDGLCLGFSQWFSRRFWERFLTHD